MEWSRIEHATFRLVAQCLNQVRHRVRKLQLQILYMTDGLLVSRLIVNTDHKLNSVALVRTRTIPTERPPPVGEVSANFSG